MDAQKQSLQKELDILIELANRQINAYVSSRNLLYQALSKALVWWMKARKGKGYLEALYEKRGINYKKETAHSVAFTPLIRLIWDIDHVRYSNTIDQWNRALNEMWGEVQSKPDYYKKDPTERLITYISLSGGITKLAGYNVDADVRNEKEPKTGRSAKRRELSQTATDNAHYDEGKRYFATSAAALAKLQLGQQLATGDAQLVVGVLRRKGSRYELLGATADESVLRQAVIKAYKRDSAGQPPTLRLLTEIVRTQTLPPVMAALARTLPDSTNLRAENGEKMRAIKRLRYCAQSSTFLLSPSRTNCGVVTIAKPRNKILNSKSDLVTTAQDRAFIEGALIQSDDFNLYEVDSVAQIKRITDKEEKATHKLRLLHKATTHVRYVRFYPVAIHEQASQPQAMLNLAKKHASLWQSNWDADWINDFYVNFWSRWINGYGKQITRPSNKVLKLCFGRANIAVGYNVRGGDFAEVAQQPSAGAVKGKATDVCVLSKDIVPVMHALSQIETTGAVRVSVSEGAVIFGFKTISADYMVAVPACTIRGKRLDASFTSYNG